MEKKMEIIELLLDEENEVTGIEAVSIVEAPAIESDFVALKSQEIQLAKENINGCCIDTQQTYLQKAR